jgi:hypothetical protein
VRFPLDFCIKQRPNLRVMVVRISTAAIVGVFVVYPKGQRNRSTREVNDYLVSFTGRIGPLRVTVNGGLLVKLVSIDRGSRSIVRISVVLPLN